MGALVCLLGSDGAEFKRMKGFIHEGGSNVIVDIYVREGFPTTPSLRLEKSYKIIIKENKDLSL